MLSNAVRAGLVLVWSHRAGTERSARTRFTRLAERLAAAGAPDTLVAMARTAADDELRHERLCTDLAARFGPPTPPIDDGAPEIAPTSLAPRDRLLYEVFAFCGLTETMNAALLTATLPHVTEPDVRRVVREILSDEVRHARLGWGYLAWETGRRDCAFLGALVPLMLEGSIAEEALVAREPSADENKHLAVGNLPWRLRIDCFLETLRDVVLPGLETHRVPTEPAHRWLERRLA